MGVRSSGATAAAGRSPCSAHETVQRPTEREAWIALGSVPGVGPASFAAILRRFGDARAALAADPSLLVESVSRADAATLAGLRLVQRLGIPAAAGQLVEHARRASGTVVTGIDELYPPQLARLELRPPVLYVVGSTSVLVTPSVAIVGTRRPSGYGRAMATEIADELSRAGVTIVSGLALGIDGAAHLAALEAGGRTVAVLPSPIDRVYPPRHRTLAERIVRGGGALISEAPPGRLTGKPDFARRNRIISGLADAVVVVEAPDHSGALLTAAAAMSQGRDLYAVPGPIDAITSSGCNRLIADHQAELITSAVSLVQRLGLRPAGRSAATAVARLSDTEGVVLGALIKRSGSIEELQARIQLSTASVASALTLLEARGLVTNFGGVTFHPTLAARQMAAVRT